jgi:hypothetical protein
MDRRGRITGTVAIGVLAIGAPRSPALGSTDPRGSKPTGGKLELSFGEGVAAGMVTMASPDLLNSTFTGAPIVECLVPASAQPPDDSEALVLDAEFETDACKPFAILK